MVSKVLSFVLVYMLTYHTVELDKGRPVTSYFYLSDFVFRYELERVESMKSSTRHCFRESELSDSIITTMDSVLARFCGTSLSRASIRSRTLS